MKHRLLIAAACVSAASVVSAGSAAAVARPSPSTKAPHATVDKGPVTWWVPGPDTVPGTSQSLATAFTKKTGIKVDLEMYPWSGYTTKLTTAITSGQTPDLAEFGNTDAATLARTGAFLPWTKQRLTALGTPILKTAMEVTGIPGKAPISVPFGAGTWVLLWNKQLFKAAHISSPPLTWSAFYADAKRLSDPAKDVYGAAIAAGTTAAMNTWAWILGQQYGVPYYTKSGQPNVATNADAAAIAQFIDWVYPDKIMAPDNVANSSNGDNNLFDANKAAMDITQNPQAAISHPSQYGLSLIPLPQPTPPGGKEVMSHIAGINLGVFKDTKHLQATLAFVKYLMSPAAQVIDAKGEVELPATPAALAQPYFQTPSMKAYGEILAKYAAATPAEASSGTLLNDMGDLIVKLFQQDAASHSGPSTAQVLAGLQQVQQTVQALGGAG